MTETASDSRPNLANVRKGDQLKLKDGRIVTVTGLYLSSSGPALMVKPNPSQLVSENVPYEDVESKI